MKTLKNILNSGKILLASGLASFLSTGCEDSSSDYKLDVPQLTHPWVILTSPENNAEVSLNTAFSWRIMNVESEQTYSAVLYTDKGAGPLDGNYEDWFIAGNVTAKEGAGKVDYYEGYTTNANATVPFLDQSITISLPSARYSGKNFSWAVEVTDTKTNKGITYEDRTAHAK